MNRNIDHQEYNCYLNLKTNEVNFKLKSML